VALCRECHDKAEGGAFTVAQLKELKVEGGARNELVQGTFEWRRRQLITHIGQTLTLDTPVPLAFEGAPIVQLSTDERGDVAVSVDMLTTSALPRLRMIENDWISTGAPIDLESPPFGKRLKAEYSNGERISIEFTNIDSALDLAAALPFMMKAREWAVDLAESGMLRLPAALVDIEFELPEIGLSITAKGTKTSIGLLRGNYAAQVPIGISLGQVPARLPAAINAVGIAFPQPSLRFASTNE
jgi:hypothetical protein